MNDQTIAVAVKQFVENFARINLGKYHDYDGAYSNQCVDLIKLWIDNVITATIFMPQVGKRLLANVWLGNANQHIDNKNILYYCDPIQPGLHRPGDIIVWDTDVYAPYGHVAVSMGGNKVVEINGDKYLKPKPVEVNDHPVDRAARVYRIKPQFCKKVVEVYKPPTTTAQPTPVLNKQSEGGIVVKTTTTPAQTPKTRLKKIVASRKEEITQMRLDDKDKVHKQKMRNIGFLAFGFLLIYNYLESSVHWFIEAERIVGHEYAFNLFAVVLPSAAYWLINNYVFKKVNNGNRISLILKPLLLGVGDKDYKKDKDTKAKEVDELEDLLELL